MRLAWEIHDIQYREVRLSKQFVQPWQIPYNFQQMSKYNTVWRWNLLLKQSQAFWAQRKCLGPDSKLPISMPSLSRVKLKKPDTRSSMQTKISDLFDPASSKLASDIIKKGVLPSSFFGDTKDKPKKQPDEKAKPSSPTETVEIKPKTSDSDSTKAEDIEMKPTEDKPELEPTEFQPKTDPQDSVACGLFGGVEDEGPTFDTDMVEPDMESLEAVESLLCVAPPWCNLIVTKQKTWELRSYQTKVRNLVYD